MGIAKLMQAANRSEAKEDTGQKSVLIGGGEGSDFFLSRTRSVSSSRAPTSRRSTSYPRSENRTLTEFPLGSSTSSGARPRLSPSITTNAPLGRDSTRRVTVSGEGAGSAVCSGGSDFFVAVAGGSTVGGGGEGSVGISSDGHAANARAPAIAAIAGSLQTRPSGRKIGDRRRDGRLDRSELRKRD